MKKLCLAAALCVAPVFAHADQPPTLDKVKASRTIVLGVREASYPLSYLDSDKNFIGYHIEICNRIADVVKTKLALPKLKVESKPVTSQSRIPAIVDGSIDLECGSTTNTEARQKQVAFAPTTYLATVKMAVKKRSGVKDLRDLDGRTVVTTAGATGIDLLREHESGRGLVFKAVYGKDHGDSFQMLAADQAQAFVMDDNLLAGLIMNSGTPDTYAITGRSLDLQPIAIMLRKNDPAFKAVVDETVSAMMKSGELARLYIKWFQSPIPPSNLNLNFPMNDLLRMVLTYPDSAPAESYRPKE